MSRKLAVVVLAAGLGKRTKVPFPKVLLPLCGKTLLETVLDRAAELAADRTVVVVHHGKGLVERVLAGRQGAVLVDQGVPRGTGHAVRAALPALEGFRGDVLVLYGDAALITAASLDALRAARESGAAALSMLTAAVPDPTGLGRVLRGPDGGVTAVREHRDCSAAELELDEINAGFYCYDSAVLPAALEALRPDNAQRELYLTDTVAYLLAAKQRVVALGVEDHEEVAAVNTLGELALARKIMQERIVMHHLQGGVVIDDPATTFIDQGVKIGPGTRILPCTVIHSGVRIGAECEVGPFCQLRAGTVLEDGAEVGNFVEVKNSAIGKRAKAKHLAYLGDAKIGERANVGCGTITANYDGVHKHETVVGDRAFLGSGTVLVAPCTVGSGAITGAGAVVKRGAAVGAGEVWIGVPAHKLRDVRPEERRR